MTALGIALAILIPMLALFLLAVAANRKVIIYRDGEGK